MVGAGVLGLLSLPAGVDSVVSVGSVAAGSGVVVVGVVVVGVVAVLSGVVVVD
jgi:hypothetical protein